MTFAKLRFVAKGSRNQWVKYGKANKILRVKNLLRKIEVEFLKSPENFKADYGYVLTHRIRGKIQALQKDIALLNSAGFMNLAQFSKNLTENNKNIAENIKIQQCNQGLNWSDLR